jgi:predicted DNA-binding transcriptional regulator AlpA
MPEACQRRVVVPSLLPPLLRLRDVVSLMGSSRDHIEVLCRDGKVIPFFKKKGSKAWYRTWQFKKLVPYNDAKIQPPPGKQSLRRKEVARWLGVPTAEIESWVRLKCVKRRRSAGQWGHFDRDEVMQKVLGQKRVKTADFGSMM